MSSYDPKKIGQRINVLRLSKGLTMNEFGSLIDSNVKSGTVTNWESGKNAPNKKRLKRIADLFGISVDFLLNGNHMTTDEIQNFYKQISSKSNLTSEEKMIARELSIENKVVISNTTDQLNKESHKIFKDDFFNNLTPEESVLANQVAILFNHVSNNEPPKDFLKDLSVYLAGITYLIAGNSSKAEFSEFQDAFNDSINKNFK